MIELTQEEIQDYKSIFKIDLARTLSEAIKRQVLLNKDFDLSFFLQASDNEIAANGARLQVDLDDYTAGAPANYTPSHVNDVLKAVVPRISTLVGIIRRNYNMYPSYLVTGLKSAALLRSLQDMMVTIPNVRGEVGWTGSAAQFLKMKVLESNAMPDTKMYLSTKAPNNALEKSSIIDLIFQPLYIVEETTDGNKRNFVRARTMVEVARTDGLGLLEVANMDNYIA